MKNLLDKKAMDEIIERIHKLHSDSTAGWGKMNVSQMLAHVQETFKVPLSDEPMPRLMLGRLIGWMIKPKLYNETPWKKNLPTAPNFIIKDERDFEKEKRYLINLINNFYSAGAEGIGRYPHPMFGSFTKEQWGKSMYKHADHHLMQFGV